jgi:hypothetical protein
MYNSIRNRQRTRKEGRKARRRKAREKQARGRKEKRQASCNKVVVLMRAVFSERQFL